MTSLQAAQRAYDERLPDDYREPKPEEVYKLEEWEERDLDDDETA